MAQQANHNKEAENGSESFIPRRGNCWACINYYKNYYSKNGQVT